MEMLILVSQITPSVFLLFILDFFNSIIIYILRLETKKIQWILDICKVTP